MIMKEESTPRNQNGRFLLLIPNKGATPYLARP
jgi:hypothetical protein